MIEAPDGAAALQVLAREEVDLVLLDVVMPGLSGFEVCRRIKAEVEGFLPVILLTALDDQEHKNAGLEAGADEFLGKPFDRRELLLRARALLRLRQQDARIREQDARLRAQLEEMSQLQALKDELFTLIVHDVRNPLTGVVGFVDLLRTGETDERRRRWAETALEGARKVEEVLGGVLEVQLLEAGQQALRPEACSPRRVIDDAVASLVGAARARDIAVDVLGEEPASLVLDRRLVRRAVENLLGNALKYSPARSRVEVLLRPEGPGLAIEVHDAGPGVPDPLKGVLFQKFGSVEARSGQARRGHGLGLHLVKLVAQAHGGAVEVRDRPGGGSVFVLILRGVA